MPLRTNMFRRTVSGAKNIASASNADNLLVALAVERVVRLGRMDAELALPRFLFDAPQEFTFSRVIYVHRWIEFSTSSNISTDRMPCQQWPIELKRSEPSSAVNALELGSLHSTKFVALVVQPFGPKSRSKKERSKRRPTHILRGEGGPPGGPQHHLNPRKEGQRGASDTLTAC